MSEDTARPERPADLPSDSDIDFALDAMNTEYEGAHTMFLDGIKNRDFFTVLMSVDFVAELTAKIRLITEAVPHIVDEAVKAKAEAAAKRYQEMLDELDKALEDETAALEAENPGLGGDDHGVIVVDL